MKEQWNSLTRRATCELSTKFSEKKTELKFNIFSI